MADVNIELFLKLMNSEISSLRGVGVKRAEAFSRMGIYTVGDLIDHFPRAYQNRGNIRKLSEAIIGENCSYLLTVGTEPRSATLKNRKVLTKFRAFDESGTVEITYFNSRYLENAFRVGETHRFWGKVNRVGKRLIMSAPIHEFCVSESELPDFTPVYSVGSGLTQGFIQEVITSVLIKLSENGACEVIPKELRNRLMLPTASAAYRFIHRPRNMDEIEAARRYFSARELYLFSLGMSITNDKKRSGTPPKMSKGDISPLLGKLGFPLTNAQSRSVGEISADMLNADLPMMRLLSGDVGSGKTAVAAAAIYLSLTNGYQAALMAPTEILASQHADSLAPIFESLGFSVGLLLGSTGAKAKRELKEKIKDSAIDLLIGTHALITEDTVFKNLGIVITDEQHRFGVNQRARLGKNNLSGLDPHMLVMTATPIPRTLALILYGDLSLSTLDELPPGRQRVDTFVVDESYRERLNAFIEKQVKGGGQVYIVCPAVESKTDDEDGDLLSFSPDGIAELALDKPKMKNATDHREYLSDELPDLNIALIHGRMKALEKDAVMKDFAEGKTDVLVSTTVIEVGVNVPNASLMIVENADRFGLSQLHQLRGRVGRGNRKAYCVLVSDSAGENAKKRLDVMKTTYDGYKIAEYDLKFRGPGDYFPRKNGNARQSGSFGSMVNADMLTLKEAMTAAEEVVKNDPNFEKEENLYAAFLTRQLMSADEKAMQ